MSKCDLCDKPAVVHEVRVTKGVRKEIHLCEVHAHNAGILIPADLSLSKMQEAMTGANPAQRRSVVKLSVCKECGMNIREFRQSGTLGCPECYEVFGKTLAPLIERAQRGATHHCGKAPKRKGTCVDRQHLMRKLLKELEEAITAEQYERAAQLRDRLRTFERESAAPDVAQRGELGKA